MRLGGSIRRIEIIPDTEEEKAAIQDIIDGKVVIYWGDTGEEPSEYGSGLILNSSVEAQPPMYGYPQPTPSPAPSA